MPLTLTIRNVGRLDNGSPLSLVLDRRGAIIGRAATCDWCLPDPSLHVSSRHCQIRFGDGRYELIDTSTNGTFLYGQASRLAVPHAIAPGDVFVIGRFEIAVALDDAAAAAAIQVNASAAEPEWQGWQSAGSSAEAAPAASRSAWDAAPAGAAISGSGPMSQNWAPPATSPPPPPVQDWGPAPTSPNAQASTWDVGPTPAPAWGASDWSSPAAPPAPPAADDIWGKFAESNVVDWARGGFGAPPAPVPAPSPAFGSPPAASGAPGGFGAPPPAFAPVPPTQHTAPPPPMPPIAAPAAPPAPSAAPGGAALATLLAAAGIDPARVTQGESEVLAQAGDVLRRTIAGLVVMLEARARAKAQMGAQSTNLEFDGNNPLKFARSPEQALAQLLNPPERGFMNGQRAIEDAFKDLQAHQMATLRAMQGALRATLDRFSPKAIRARAETGGILARILPGARDAALWNAYEKEFGGVALGSDEAFMDIFAKEFRIAYDELSAKR